MLSHVVSSCCGESYSQHCARRERLWAQWHTDGTHNRSPLSASGSQGSWRSVTDATTDTGIPMCRAVLTWENVVSQHAERGATNLRFQVKDTERSLADVLFKPAVLVISGAKVAIPSAGATTCSYSRSWERHIIQESLPGRSADPVGRISRHFPCQCTHGPSVGLASHQMWRGPGMDFWSYPARLERWLSSPAPVTRHWSSQSQVAKVV